MGLLAELPCPEIVVPPERRCDDGARRVVLFGLGKHRAYHELVGGGIPGSAKCETEGVGDKACEGRAHQLRDRRDLGDGDRRDPAWSRPRWSSATDCRQTGQAGTSSTRSAPSRRKCCTAAGPCRSRTTRPSSTAPIVETARSDTVLMTPCSASRRSVRTGQTTSGSWLARWVS